MIKFYIQVTITLSHSHRQNTLWKWSQGFWAGDSCFHLNSTDKTRNFILIKDVKIRDNVFVQVWTVAFFFFNQFGSVVLGVNIFVFILLRIHLTSQVCRFMIFIKLRTFLHDFFESFSASFSLSFLMTHSACLFIHMIFSVKFYSFFFEIIFLCFLDNDFCWSIFKFIWFICQVKYFVYLSNYFFISVIVLSKFGLSFFQVLFYNFCSLIEKSILFIIGIISLTFKTCFPSLFWLCM